MTRELVNYQNMSPAELDEQAQLILNIRLKRLEDDVSYLKDEAPIEPAILLMLEKKRKSVVIDSLGGTTTAAYKKISKKVFAEAGRDFKNHFNIHRYDMLPKKFKDQAFEYWEDWQPSTNTKMEIKQLNSQLELIQRDGNYRTDRMQ